MCWGGETISTTFYYKLGGDFEKIALKKIKDIPCNEVIVKRNNEEMPF